MRLRHAFTLIELLVVIAIIAILAAILFPVFAQAKEAAKKAASISDVKQTGTGMIMYTNDYDDLFPLALTPNSAANPVTQNPWRRTGGMATPPGWIVTPRYQPHEDEVGFANSIQPYMKSYDLLDLKAGQALPEFATAEQYANPLKPYKNTGLTMNGLLMAYSASAVESPSKLTLAWYGVGKQSIQGFAVPMPRLNCRGAGPCRFNSGALPQAGFSSTQGDEWNRWSTMWVYGNGNIFAHTDSSAKYRRMGSNAGSDQFSGDGNNDPFARYFANGEPRDAHRCIFGDGPAYMCFFRPDNPF
jgi:prepilin-type N-terminal cleavage/methylation domain-containing protein